ALGLEAQLLRRHERLQNSAALDDFQFILKSTASDRISMIVSQVNLVLIVIFGAVLVVEQTLTVGSLAACILLSSRMISPIQRMIGLWARLQFIKIADDRYHEILNLPQESKGEINLRKVRGHIQFKNVHLKSFENE